MSKLEFIVEWIDWDDKLHKTKYVPSANIIYRFNDFRQIKASSRSKIKEILQRYKL